MRALSIAAVLALASCAGPAVKPSVGERYFVQNRATSAMWLHLRSDGTFAIHIEEHLYSEISTTGTWTRVSENMLSLTESNWLRSVVCGSVIVSVGDSEGLEKLPYVREEIEKWLQGHPDAASVSKEELETVGQWDGESEGPDGRKFRWTCVPLFVTGDSASRQDVEGLLPAIESYLRANDKHSVPVVIFKQKGRTFLHWPAGGGMLLQRWSLAEINEAMESAGPEDLPVSIYVETTKEAFDEMARRELKPNEK
jgi:hypothetical protein